MEELYHYLWKTGILGRNFRDIDGRKIEVIDPGRHNTDAGPDFFNTKLKIGETGWAGNVEIHVKASDWFRHGHDSDPAYDNVILHVVSLSDKRVFRSDGSLIPQAVLTFPESFFRLAADLSDHIDSVRCSRLISSIPYLNKEDWLESLAIERLQAKAAKVLEIHNSTDGDWEQTCFILFARSLGFGLNSDPFEILARSIPLRILHHHSDNIFQLEAILFGQAGMLDSTIHIFDDYYQALCREYYFLARKYGLHPLRSGQWKYSKTRPHNFPHRRIALLAKSTVGGFSLFARLKEARKDIDDLKSLFNHSLEGYWEQHFSFDTEARNVNSTLSDASRELLIINLAIPLLYAYASRTSDIELAEKAANLLYQLPAENNAIIRQWKTLGFSVNDSSRSQALLHLRREYCDKQKCFYCRFGNLLLRKASLSSCNQFNNLSPTIYNEKRTSS